MDRRRRLLIIEDHESLGKLLGILLSKTYDVVIKKDGLEALASLSNGFIPDLILLDLNLPRLNGLEFLQKIRQSGFFKNIPVLVVSGKEKSKYFSKCQALGVIDFVQKPFDPSILHKQIKDIFSASRQLEIN